MGWGAPRRQVALCSHYFQLCECQQSGQRDTGVTVQKTIQNNHSNNDESLTTAAATLRRANVEVGLGLNAVREITDCFLDIFNLKVGRELSRVRMPFMPEEDALL